MGRDDTDIKTVVEMKGMAQHIWQGFFELYLFMGTAHLYFMGNIFLCIKSPSGKLFLENNMEKRIALIGIIVEKETSVEALNHLLHEYRKCVVGRMGIPYRDRGVNIISVAVDAPQDEINALSGKIGRLDGISAKTVYSNVVGNH